MEEDIAILMADLSGYKTFSEPSAFTFESKGKHSFKNISEEKEVFELITDHPKAFIIDPVCRMIISDSANAVQHP